VIALPILLSMLFAILCLFAWSHPALQRGLAVAGAALLALCAVWILSTVLASGIQTMQIGGWPAPYGITLVTDLFSAILLLVAALVALAVAVYSLAAIDDARVRHGFYPLYFLLLSGSRSC
jgi:multicomponent Na+:H+ antiporter subunit D